MYIAQKCISSYSQEIRRPSFPSREFGESNDDEDDHRLLPAKLAVAAAAGGGPVSTSTSLGLPRSRFMTQTSMMSSRGDPSCSYHSLKKSRTDGSKWGSATVNSTFDEDDVFMDDPSSQERHGFPPRFTLVTKVLSF